MFRIETVREAREEVDLRMICRRPVLSGLSGEISFFDICLLVFDLKNQKITKFDCNQTVDCIQIKGNI